MAVPDEVTESDDEFFDAVEETCSPASKKIATLEAEIAELRCALYDEQHGISFHMRDAKSQRRDDLLRRALSVVAGHATFFHDGTPINELGALAVELSEELMTPNAKVSGGGAFPPSA